MISENSIKLSLSYVIVSKLKDYFQLTKFTLSFMVVFSSVVGYWMAVPRGDLDLTKVLLLFAGGLLITGSANAINQVMEKDTDALMSRTKKRPLPDGRMKTGEAIVFAAILAVAGLAVMAFTFNVLSAVLSLISIVLYGFVYTPWKKWNSSAVLVGAIPGALPPLIGWVAGTGSIGAGGWVLFAIQFLWQFPHFWAIAWVAYEDYQKAGFKLLPSGEGKNQFSALQSLTYTLLLIPVGLLPYYLKMSGIVSAAIILAAGIFFIIRAFRLYKRCNIQAARQLMFGSYIYLIVIQLALLADKI